jgi:hypothetical protein
LASAKARVTHITAMRLKQRHTKKGHGEDIFAMAGFGQLNAVCTPKGPVIWD